MNSAIQELANTSHQSINSSLQPQSPSRIEDNVSLDNTYVINVSQNNLIPQNVPNPNIQPVQAPATDPEEARNKPESLPTQGAPPQSVQQPDFGRQAVIEPPAPVEVVVYNEGDNRSEESDGDLTFNPIGKLEFLSRNKMNNFEAFLALNFFAHSLGFLFQLNLINYKIISCAIFAASLGTLIKITCGKGRINFHKPKGRNKLFKVINWTCLTLYFFIAIIKCFNQFDTFYLWAIPGCINIIAESFLTTSVPSFRDQGAEIVIKYAAWAQLLLIALKTDGATMPWTFTLFIIISLTFISSLIALLALIVFVSTLLGASCYSATGKIAILGSGWYLVMSGSNVLWGVITLCVEKRLTSVPDQTPLSFLFLIGIISSPALILFTKIFNETLLLFLKHETLITLQELGEFLDFDTEILFNNEGFNRNFYLAKITGTYFTPFRKSFHIKDKVALDKWSKEIEVAKFSQPSHRTKETLSTQSLQVSPSKIGPSLHTKRSNSLDLAIDIPITIKELSRNLNTSQDNEQVSPSLSFMYHRASYSLDDKDIRDKVKRPYDEESMVEDKYKDMCLVCCNAEANAVIMDCGHGGICYGCAVKGWKKSDKCHMCRGEIRSIYKVKNLPRLKMARVLDETEKVFNEDEVEFQREALFII